MIQLSDVQIVQIVASRLAGKTWAELETEQLPNNSGRGNNLRRAVYKKLFPRTRSTS